MYFVNKNAEKKKDKIKELIFLKKNYSKNKHFITVRKKIKKKKSNLKRKNSNCGLLKKIYNKKLIRSTLLRKRVLKNFINYRNYPHLMNLFKNSLKVVFRIRSNLKF